MKKHIMTILGVGAFTLHASTLFAADIKALGFPPGSPVNVEIIFSNGWLAKNQDLTFTSLTSELMDASSGYPPYRFTFETKGKTVSFYTDQIPAPGNTQSKFMSGSVYKVFLSQDLDGNFSFIIEGPMGV
jgi:hypothetical protein